MINFVKALGTFTLHIRRLYCSFVERDLGRLTNVVLCCLFIELYIDSKQQCYKDLGFKRYYQQLFVHAVGQGYGCSIKVDVYFLP